MKDWRTYDPKKVESDKELIFDHSIIHSWWNNPKLRPKGITEEDLKRLHDEIVQEMKRRGIEHHTPLELEKPYAVVHSFREQSLGEEIELSDVLKWYEKPIVLAKDFVCLVGGLSERGKTDGDIDLLIRWPENVPDEVVHPVRFRLGRALPKELAERVQFLLDKYHGPFTSYVPLYDLVLVPKEHQIVHMEEDLNKPLAVFKKKRMFGGQWIDSIGIVLKGRGCGWGQCKFCWYGRIKYEGVTDENIYRQFEYALQEYPGIEAVFVFTNGAFNDDAEIPRDLRMKIFKLLQEYGVRYVCLEGRANLPMAPFVELKKNYEDIQLQVALGVEVRDEKLRMETLNKPVKDETIEQAIKELKDNGIEVRAYVLLKPPFVDESRAVEEIKQAIDWLSDLNVDIVDICCAKPDKRAPEFWKEFTSGKWDYPQVTSLAECVRYGLEKGVAMDVYDYSKMARTEEDKKLRQKIKDAIKTQNAKLLSFESSAEQQAEKSKKEDRIEPLRFFYPLKATKGYHEGEVYNLEQILAWFKHPEDYPLVLQKKYDGLRIIWSKKGDTVYAWTDDGTRCEDRFPTMVKMLKELPVEELVLDSETEGWSGKEHWGREITAGYARAHDQPADDANFVVNVFDVLYVDGLPKHHELDVHGDLHEEPYEVRLRVLDYIGALGGWQSTDEVPKTPGFNVVKSYWLEKPDVKELEKLLEHIKNLPGSEGVMIKSAKSDYPLTGHTNLWLKYKKSADVHAVVIERLPTKTEGVYRYRVGLLLPAGWEAPEDEVVEIMLKNGKKVKVLDVGKTFNTDKELEQGDIVTVMFHTLFVYDDGRVKLYEPKLYEVRPDQVIPDTVTDAIKIAEQANLVQRKFAFPVLLVTYCAGRKDTIEGTPSELWKSNSRIQKVLQSGLPVGILHSPEKGIILPHEKIRAGDARTTNWYDGWVYRKRAKELGLRGLIIYYEHHPVMFGALRNMPIPIVYVNDLRIAERLIRDSAWWGSDNWVLIYEGEWKDAPKDYAPGILVAWGKLDNSRPEVFTQSPAIAVWSSQEMPGLAKWIYERIDNMPWHSRPYNELAKALIPSYIANRMGFKKLHIIGTTWWGPALVDKNLEVVAFSDDVITRKLYEYFTEGKSVEVHYLIAQLIGAEYNPEHEMIILMERLPERLDNIHLNSLELIDIDEDGLVLIDFAGVSNQDVDCKALIEKMISCKPRVIIHSFDTGPQGKIGVTIEEIEPMYQRYGYKLVNQILTSGNGLLRVYEKASVQQAELMSKLRYGMQFHFRGGSVHADLRIEKPDESALQGWTLAIQEEDLFEKEVMKHWKVEKDGQLRKVYWDGELYYVYDMKKDEVLEWNSKLDDKILKWHKDAVWKHPDWWKIDLKTGKPKERQPGEGVDSKRPVVEKIWATKKQDEPLEWLDVEGVYPPREIEPVPGGTRFWPGVFVRVDSGTVEYGAQKSYFKEYFFDGKVLKGRYVLRLVNRNGELIWLFWKTDDETPYVISKRAVETGWIPPLGESALPEEWEKKVPKVLRWWEAKDVKEARRRRDEFVKQLKLESDRFLLQYQWWKGPVVIRRGPSEDRYYLRVIRGDGVLEIEMDGDPRKEHVPGVVRKVEYDEFWDVGQGTVIDVPPGTKYNDTKATPSWLMTLDSGKAKVLEEDPLVLKIDLGENRTFIAVRSSPDEDVWECWIDYASPEVK